MSGRKFRDISGKGLHIAFYVLIVVMAFCTGLLLKQTFTHDVETYKQLRKSETTREQIPLITLSENSEPESEPGYPETIDIPFTDMLNNAVQAGGDLLNDLVDTLVNSETGQQMFTDEERKQLEDLSQFTNDMIDLLTQNQDGTDSGR